MQKVKKSEVMICYENDFVKYVFESRMKNLLKRHKTIEDHSLFVFIREDDMNKMICMIEIRS